MTQALKYPKWHLAMSEEYDALVRNGTWELVPSYSIHNIVGCKWIFRTKRHSDGFVDRHKARLVAKGFHQLLGIDYHDTFSLVVKPTTIRLVLSLAVSRGWSLRQLDVNNAFLQGHFFEDVYMSQPPAWYHELRKFLIASGFHNSHADTSLFVLNTGGNLLYLLVYVDDIILTGNDDTMVHKFMQLLAHQFSLKGTLSAGGQLQKRGKGNSLGWRATSEDDLTSTSAYVVYIGRNPISWSSKKQRTIVRSSMEAEYQSIAATAAELNRVSSLLIELGVVLPQSPLIYCDNIGATNLCSNPVFHSKMKHVAIDFHFIREQVQNGTLHVSHVSSDDQLANALTKPLPKSWFLSLKSKISLVTRPQS
ncbi:Retrovirus-related Pol polyprotein from transposon RE1 [Vitis vinifera]|uniref:Retrovirus-related Pol polyprotein from transposon RE1 n=1 Tax=Vitis vinifera TaxID=29760 RepID=A0A438GGL2_VITVI|nr:Retrovirus-related Pol polyprotein from transposon RE1 [Vitis vinifera]